MRTRKLAATIIAMSVAAATLLSGCATVPSEDSTNTSGATGTTDPSGDSSGDDTQGSEPTPTPSGNWTQTLSYAEGTVLRMATGYNSAATGLTFDADTAGSGVTLANGQTYNTGDFKPTWVTVQDKLKFTIEDVYGGNSATNEFEEWKSKMDQVDVVSGTASKLTENNELMINLADYLDQMPYFKAYLEANPIVRLSITGSTTGDNSGAIYFSPYFDGVNDIERMPLMRTDWVEKLLDGDGEFTAEQSGQTAAPVYQPYMPLEGKIDIDVVKLDGSGTETVTKDYDAAGNIVAKMNEAGSMSGVDAVNMLRTYIDEAYNGYYGTTRSNLFVGQNAAWDADELVALLRCVVANAQTLNGTDTVQGVFTRNDGDNQRRVDMFRFAGTLFGVRGLESRQDYLYVGTDGELHDARQEADTYVALDRMNAMVKEGLISENFVNNSDEGQTTKYLETDTGFMHYDYNQTQTAYNQTYLDDGEEYRAAMVPVALWFDGTSEGGVWMRFTESWRSVKTDGWGISKQGVGDNQDKLYAALTLIDYAYSPEGMILMSYGPDDFIKTNADGSYETFNFNGTEMPVIADKTYDEMWEKANGSYTDYARKYLGSTLSFAKSQAFEYQCTHEVGKVGAGYISNAIGFGTIKHVELDITDNPWYTSVPTVLPQTTTENTDISALTELSSSGKFSSSSGQGNLLIDIIVGGYTGDGTSSADETINTVSTTWGGSVYLELRNAAWDRLKTFYEGL